MSCFQVSLQETCVHTGISLWPVWLESSWLSTSVVESLPPEGLESVQELALVYRRMKLGNDFHSGGSFDVIFFGPFALRLLYLLLFEVFHTYHVIF